MTLFKHQQNKCVCINIKKEHKNGTRTNKKKDETTADMLVETAYACHMVLLKKLCNQERLQSDTQMIKYICIYN